MIFALLLAACSSDEVGREKASNTFTQNKGPAPLELEIQDEGTVDFETADKLPRRDNKRLDIAQLQASLKLLTGMEWTEGGGTAGQEQFSVLSATLGVPDYRNSVVEDRTPSMTYEKFLKDAASSICTKLIDQRATNFFVHASIQDTWDSNPQAIKDNILYHLLRFHGERYSDSDSELDHWEWLWRSIYTQSTGSVDERSSIAWRGVCVALIVHPRFSHY